MTKPAHECPELDHCKALKGTKQPGAPLIIALLAYIVVVSGFIGFILGRLS